MAFSTGKIYYSNYGSNAIRWGNKDGTGMSYTQSGVSGPDGIALDRFNSKIYFANIGTDTVMRASMEDPDVDRETIASGFTQMEGLAFDHLNNRLYYAEASLARIGYIDLDDNSDHTIVSGLTTPEGIDLDFRHGKVYWTDSGEDVIKRSNFDGTDVEVIVSGGDLAVSRQLALDTSKELIYWTDETDDNIRRSTLDGDDVTVLVSGLIDPKGIDLDVYESKMYITSGVFGLWGGFGTFNLSGGDPEDLFADYHYPIYVRLYLKHPGRMDLFVKGKAAESGTQDIFMFGHEGELLRHDDVVWYHPLDDEYEYMQGQHWENTHAVFDDGVIDQGLIYFSAPWKISATGSVFNLGLMDADAVVEIDDTRVLAAYRPTRFTTDFRVMSVVGTTVTSGEAITIGHANQQHPSHVCKIADEKYVAVWKENGTADIRGCVLTVSGTTVASGAERFIDGDGKFPYIARLDDTHALVTYNDNLIANSFLCRAIEISGTTIPTVGAQKTISSSFLASHARSNIVGVQSDKAYVFYGSAGSSNNLYAASISISGTTCTVDDSDHLIANDHNTSTARYGLHAEADPGNPSGFIILYTVVSGDYHNGEGRVGSYSEGGGWDLGAKTIWEQQWGEYLTACQFDPDNNEIAVATRSLQDGTNNKGIDFRTLETSGTSLIVHDSIFIVNLRTHPQPGIPALGKMGTDEAMLMIDSGLDASEARFHKIVFDDEATEFNAYDGSVYPYASGVTRVTSAFWGKNPTANEGDIEICRSYAVHIHQTNIVFGSGLDLRLPDEAAVWENAAISGLLNTLNDGSNHMLVTDFEHVSGTTWQLRTSLDGADWTDQGTQTSGTQSALTGTESNPYLAAYIYTDDSFLLDEVALWFDADLFSDTELEHLYELANTHDLPFNQYSSLFGTTTLGDVDLFLHGHATVPTGSLTERRIYWTDTLNDQIYWKTPDKSASGTVPVSGLVAAWGLAIDDDNKKVYWGDVNKNEISRSDLDGNNQEIVISGIDAIGMAIDVVRGKIYWSDQTLGTINRANIDGSYSETLVSGLVYPSNLDLDLVRHRIYFTDYTAGLVYRVPMFGGPTEVITPSGMTNPGVITVCPISNKIFVGDIIQQEVIRAEPDGSDPLIIMSGVTPYGITIDCVDQRVYVSEQIGDRVVRANQDGSDFEVFADFITGEPAGIKSVNEYGRQLFITGHLPKTSGIDLFIEGHILDTGSLDLFIHGHQPLTDNIDLFIHGYQPITDGLDLFIEGHILETGSLDLFIHGYDTATGTLDLFIEGEELTTDSLDLFIHGHEPLTDSLDLFIEGHILETGTLDLFIYGYDTATGTLDLFIEGEELLTDSLDLFIHGYDTATGNVDLFIEGEELTTGSLDLFIHGYDIATGTLDLFIHGHQPITDSLDLYIEGHQPLTDSLDLFIQGHEPQTGDLDLFIEGEELTTGSIDLFVHGHQPLTDSVDLFIEGHIQSSGDMGLFVSGIGFITDAIPLFISSLNVSAGDLDLFIHGRTSASGDLDLVIIGHEPQTGDLDLFIEGEELTTDSLDLFIHGYEPITDSLDLFIEGHILSSGTLDLYIFGHGFETGNIPLFISSLNISAGDLDLFIHGRDSASGDLDLVITGHEPQTGDLDLFIEGEELTTGSLDLFIHGFESLTDSLDLFIQGHETTIGTLDLFIHGHAIATSDLDLFIQGDIPRDEGLDLFIHGYDIQTSGLDLFIEGEGLTTGDLDLFIKGKDTETSGLDLFIEGEVANTASLDLFIEGHDTSTGDLDLYVEGHELDTSGLPLFIEGEATTTGSLDLFVHGHETTTLQTVECGLIQDTTIKDGAFVDTNFGLDTTLTVGKGADINRILLLFDISAIPSGAYIHRAEIRALGLEDTSAGTEFRSHPLSGVWVETEATWNDKSSGVAWAASGADYDPTIYDAWDIENSSGVLKTDIIATNVVQSQINAGSTQSNILLKETVEASVTTTWASDQHPSGGPILIIQYSEVQPDLDLYMRGCTCKASGMDLFVEGIASSSGDIDLFIEGEGSVTGELDLFILGPSGATVSGDMFLFIHGLEPRPALACPALDPTAAIQIPSTLIDIYQSRIDALINQLGKNITVEFDPVREDCPNCGFDPIRKRSNGIYTPGGPRPFGRGRKCPYCKGHGFLETVERKCIKCLVKWSPREVQQYGININEHKAIVRLKTHLTQADDLKRAKTVIVDADISGTVKLRAKLIKGPTPVGLREDRYCVSFWELI